MYMLDLTNKSFGNWTVLNQAAINKWNCKCVCGTEKIQRASHLVAGKTTKCWKCRKIDLTGQKFGKWLVLSRDSFSKSGWHCKCDCKFEKIVHLANLKKALKNNAGCKNCQLSIYNLTGSTFGSWKVLHKDVNLKFKGKICWICECICGNKSSILTQSLLAGKTKNCRKCADKNKSCGIKNKLNSRIIANIKQGAKRRGIEFNLGSDVKEYLYNLLFIKQNKLCALSGLPIKVSDTNNGQSHGEATASLDRIDSSIGYIKGNVQWVHKVINQMKWDMNQNEFISFCEAVARKR